MILRPDFFRKNTVGVAQKLLGKVLVRNIKGKIIRARIVETEAYHGAKDLASHACRGKTERNKVMFDVPGKIYVYLIYGRYCCLNLVTMPVGYPAAVLIRGVVGEKGRDLMLARRKKEQKNFSEKNLSNGPGKLCQALGIDRKINGKLLSKKTGLWVEDDGYPVTERNILRSKRIGVDYAGPCREWLWRFNLK